MTKLKKSTDIASDLNARGYFPREIVPPLNTRGFAKYSTPAVAAHGTGIEKVITKLCIFNVPSGLNSRRHLGIPNPISQTQLTTEIGKHWTDIEEHWNKSELSLSRPKPFDKSRGVAPRTKFLEVPHLRLVTAPERRFILRADVSRYYGSIYSHSLPWALHGKTLAKQRRTDTTLLGNRLDLKLRNTQDSQTKGIPIGPDTSLVLSELIGASVDSDLQNILSKRLPHIPLKGHRYIDDYFLYFPTRESAEVARSALEQCLKDYELQLNEPKTSIHELPDPTENSWAHEIENFPIGDESTTVLYTFFNLAFRLAKEFPSERVLKRAVSRLRNRSFTQADWKLIEPFILRSMILEPIAIPVATQYLAEVNDKWHCCNKQQVKETVLALLEHNLALERDFEVSWALWLAKTIGLELPSTAAKKLVESNDSISALVLLDMCDKKLVKGKLDWSKWKNLLVADELKGAHWLFVYEATVKGWLGSKNLLSTNPFFESLSKNGVCFYDPEASVEPEEEDHPLFDDSFEVDVRWYEDRDTYEDY